MIPGPFEYRAPATVDEAVSVLAEHGDAKVLAGGQSLIPMMRFRLTEPSLLVDVNGVEGLSRLEEADGELRIGATVRHAEVQHSDLAAARYPLLAEAAGLVADPLVRNRGTVGGSLVHADPAGDWGAVMLACGADLVARSADGERTISADDFFFGPFTTSLDPGELLVEARLPRAGGRSGGAYEKLERKVGDFATVAVAARVELDEDGACTSAGLGLTAVGPSNLRPEDAEATLEGSRLDEESLEEAGELAADASSPTSDNRGSADYKRDMVRVLTKRAVRRAAERARKGGS